MMQRNSLVALLLAGVVVCGGSAMAQDNALPPPAGDVAKSRLDLEKADFEREVNRALTLEKFKRRVPDGFASLVNPTQRAKVYQIQEEYHALIASLQARIAELEKESLVKQEEVLTAEQRVTLNKFRDDLAAKRKATAAATAAKRGGAAETATGADAEQ